jgi:hypothetical protein
MFNFTVLSLILIGFSLIILMLKQGLSRKVDIFSARNMYLVGFIVYQIISPAVSLHTGNFMFFRVYFPEETGKAFLMMVITFLAMFLFGYQKLWFTPWLARKFKFQARETDDYLLLGLACFLVILGGALRFFPLPNFVGPSVQVGMAFAAIAAAMAGWVWSNRRTNLPVAIVCGLILCGSLLIVLVAAFGRRPLLGVLMGVAWGVYHRRVRYVSPAKMMAFIAPFVVAATLVVAAFSATRSHEYKAKPDLQGFIHDMVNADLKKGMENLLGGQVCGAASLWAIEQWPERLEVRPFFSFQYMAMYFVPRFMWEDKPAPLGNDIARLANVQGVNQKGITIPPGVVGYSVAEGGYWALIIYGLFFGQFMRFIDELVKLNPTNSFIILPAAVATGQAFGLARGCIAVFSDLLILGFVATYLLLFVADRMFGRKLPQMQMMAPHPQYR